MKSINITQIGHHRINCLTTTTNLDEQPAIKKLSSIHPPLGPDYALGYF